MRSMFSSLAIPNYRTWFIGVTISNIGQWMARTAQAWLVLVILTNGSSSALGVLTAMQFLPILLFGPYAGSIADRFPKRRIIMITQSVGAIDAAVLGTLAITGYVELWMVGLLAFVDGAAGAFDGPARQAIVSEIVPPESLPNAIALNSTSFNSARLLGPGIAGLLIAGIGTGEVIALNTLSYLTLLVAVLLLKPSQMTPSPRRAGRGGVIEGLRYLRTRKDLMVFMACGLALGGLGFNFQITNAVMSTNEFGRGSSEFGALGSIMGVGALAAALLAARRSRPRLRYVLGGMLGYTVLMICAALSPNFGLFAFLQAPIGFFTITAMVTGNTLVQTNSAPQMRGRMLAIWSLMIMGVSPLISPLVGWIGDAIGPRATVMFGVVCVGTALILITTYVMRSQHLRLRIERSGTFPHLFVQQTPQRDVDDR